MKSLKSNTKTLITAWSTKITLFNKPLTLRFQASTVGGSSAPTTATTTTAATSGASTTTTPSDQAAGAPNPPPHPGRHEGRPSTTWTPPAPPGPPGTAQVGQPLTPRRQSLACASGWQYYSATRSRGKEMTSDLCTNSMT